MKTLINEFPKIADNFPLKLDYIICPLKKLIKMVVILSTLQR